MPIRLMEVSDLDEFIKLDPIIFPNEDPWNENEFNYYFGKGYSFVSYDEDTKRITGYIFVRKQQESFLIGNFGVHPSKQGQGLGRQLMSCALETCRKSLKLGQKLTFSLQVRQNNDRAKRFYDRNGFKVTHSSRSHYQMRLETVGLGSTRVAEVEQSNDSNKRKQQISYPGSNTWGLNKARSRRHTSSAAGLQQSIRISTKEKFSRIISELIQNINKGAKGRLTSGSDSQKVQKLSSMKERLANFGDAYYESARGRDATISQVRSICNIKRNPFHFWQTPHSVGEFERLLKQFNLNGKMEVKANVNTISNELN